MNDLRVDLVWRASALSENRPRHLFDEELRYAQRANQMEPVLDGYLNYHWLLSPSALGHRKVMLEVGINAPALAATDAARQPLIAVQSSPWKAEHETNPWHDDFDLDHGHVRYFGDHKPGTVGFPGVTNGNRLLLDAARLHARTSRDERLLAPPLLLFRSLTVRRDGSACG